LHIVTCGDGRGGTNSLGRADDGPTFKEMIAVSARQAQRLGYRMSIFDLGGLGMGEAFSIEDPTFLAQGYYREISPLYKSKALHKPLVVKKALSRDDLLLYLDGDAILARPLDDLAADFDLAVTLRLPYELTTNYWRATRSITNTINAGVILFRASPTVYDFIDRWNALSQRLGSDQWALNELVAPPGLDAVGSIQVRDGLRVLYLSSRQYNFYHFRAEPPSAETRIFHFKSGVRSEFWRLFPDDGRAAPPGRG